MHDLQKAGGIAALIEAATFVVGFGLLFTLLAPTATGELDSVQTVAFVAQHQALMQAWNFIIYVVFGVALVVLALALHARLRARASALMPVATAFGLIWAGLVMASGMVANIGISSVSALHATDPNQAAAMWQVLAPVRDGLGGGNEIVGGLWVLLVSWAAIRSADLPRALAYFGLVIGVAGILTTIPALAMLAALFGFGLIVWFAWLGIALLRSSAAPVVESPATFAMHSGTPS